ncbi:unnamed protein product [Acanthoscelides obtectus]|uniref:Uncharacterized protein n=1 Tax=Acanthoscelides obtectus TaxID=200917 RepID=A0A9P0NTP0_ACAOB|nr:unnamed protein product [Acanthoscelides obtectus]CAK1628981.1 hypothetical protein AOBTE_LOCUS5500 [Acanthoscelides obtectus]
MIIDACPSSADLIESELIGPGCLFRQHSDNLLQFICGKRAEAIELRRSQLAPLNTNVAMVLSKIPPSESHLFDENKIEDLLKSQAGSLRPTFKRKIPFAKQDQ